MLKKTLLFLILSSFSLHAAQDNPDLKERQKAETAQRERIAHLEKMNQAILKHAVLLEKEHKDQTTLIRQMQKQYAEDMKRMKGEIRKAYLKIQFMEKENPLSLMTIFSNSSPVVHEMITQTETLVMPQTSEQSLPLFEKSSAAVQNIIHTITLKPEEKNMVFASEKRFMEMPISRLPFAHNSLHISQDRTIPVFQEERMIQGVDPVSKLSLFESVKTVLEKDHTLVEPPIHAFVDVKTEPIGIDPEYFDVHISSIKGNPGVKLKNNQDQRLLSSLQATFLPKKKEDGRSYETIQEDFANVALFMEKKTERQTLDIQEEVTEVRVLSSLPTFIFNKNNDSDISSPKSDAGIVYSHSRNNSSNDLGTLNNADYSPQSTAFHRRNKTNNDNEMQETFTQQLFEMSHALEKSLLTQQEYEKHLKNLQSTIEDKENQLSEQLKVAAQISQQNQKYEQKNSRLLTALQEENERVTFINQSLNIMKKELEAKECKNCQKISTELSLVSNDAETLRQANVNLIGTLNDFEQKTRKEEQEKIAQLKSYVEKLENELICMNATNVSLINENTSKNKEIEDLNERVKSFHSRVLPIDKKIKAMRRVNLSENKILKKLETDDLMGKQSALLSLNERMEQEITNIGSSIARLTMITSKSWLNDINDDSTL